MAAPAFRAKTMLPGSTATSAKFTVPGTAVAGDTLYIIIKVMAGSVVTVEAPTGGQTWKEVAGQKTEPKEGWTLAIFELANWNGTTTEYTVAWGGAKDPWNGAIWVWSGTDQTNPRNVTSNATIKEVTPASKNAVVDGYTTTVNECVRVSVVANNEGFVMTPAAEWTEDGDQADGPELAHKTASVNAGVQGSVTHTSGTAVYLTLGWALQPPQPPKISGSAGGVGGTSLALTVPAILGPSSSGGSSGSSLALKAPAILAPSPAGGSGATALALSAPAKLAPSAASGTSGSALALAVAPQLSLSPAGGVGGTTLAPLEAPFGPSEGVLTAEELKAAEALDPLTREPAELLFGEDWHGIWADPGEGTPTGWTHAPGEEFSTARWWRYGFPSPAFLGLTFAEVLSEGQELRIVLADNKLGNSVVLKIVWNNPEEYFYALYEEIGGFEVEPALAQGFVPRVKGDRFYLSFEEGLNGIRAWRETGGGDPEAFAEGTLTEPLEAYGHTADLYLLHTGTFRGKDFTAVSLNPEPPIEEKPTGKMRVVLNGGGWGGKEPADIAAAVHMVRFDTELGIKHLEELTDAGLLIHCLFAGPYNEGGVSALDPDEWVADALAFYEANLDPTVSPIVEILNEPHGSWFWGEEANTAANALAYRTLVKKAYEAFHARYGDEAPKIIASVEPVDSWGERWWEPNVANYLDGVVVHPYGGNDPEEKATSAEGRRREVKEARVLTGNSLPVYCSEFGWPTAIGKEPTGDSLQWTEADQAANITSFFRWARAVKYVAEVVYFCHHDFGTNTWYGVVDLEGNHKLGYAAIQEQTAIYDRVPRRLRRKPPLELDIEVETPDGFFRLPTDSKKASKRVQIQPFSDQRGDGFTTGGVQLARQILRDYPDIALMDTWRAVGRNGDVAHEGRLQSDPRTNDPGQQINVQLAGWANYLKSRKIDPLIIDRRGSSWQGMTNDRKAQLLTAGWSVGDASAASDPNGLPAIVFEIGGSYKKIAIEALYDAGSGNRIAEILWERISKSSFGAGSPGAGFGFYVGVADDDELSGGENSADQHTAGEDSDPAGSTFSTATARRWGRMDWENPGESAGGGVYTDTSFVRNPAVVGDHGLSLIGSGAEAGPIITDIMQWILATYYPRIQWAGRTNTFPVSQADWHDNKAYGYDIFQQLNNLILWELGVWEDRKLAFEPADLTRYDWQIRTDDPGVRVVFQGDSIENFANGVEGTYTDFSGFKQTLYPSDHPELRDDSESNPANRHGEDLWIDITIDWPVSEAEALQIFRAYLIEYNRPKRPGTYKISGGYIKDGAGHWHQGWKPRSSQTLGIMDLITDEPRLITAKTWDPASKTLEITVDAPSQLLDAIAARQGVARQSRGLA